MSLGVRFTRAMYRLSPKRALHGVPTAVLFATSQAEQAVAFGKVEAALGLIRDHSPVRFQQVQRDLACIFVCGDASTAGSFCGALRMCELFISHLLAEDTTPAQIASTIVHEAQHARLERLGVQYIEVSRARVERACYRAERCFGLRLPEGTFVVAQADAGIEADPAMFSSRERVEARVRALHRLALPRWFVNLGSTWLRRRAHAREARDKAKSGPPNDEMQRTKPSQAMELRR